MRNHIITDSPNCPIFRFDTLELTSRAFSSFVFFLFLLLFIIFPPVSNSLFWHLGDFHSSTRSPPRPGLTGDGCKQEKKRENKKCTFILYELRGNNSFFLAIHDRGKKTNVKNKRQFFVSLSILTGSLPSVLGWLVAIFCMCFCLG